ncbi:hypothetical protein SD427_12960 [Chryseobacterium sp. JJR-5R]|uniref:hypothetical protein n=1 Tax=Chryseobacterium sp. JJR-5R TaxID=3093923 RepID=UPI002A75FD65|nr:hypothetical protein [Chryseobacterium sp. JJR-5R]WPO81674.1 hypothetical protein SD427_12960 [Chryseobacterium sp. JJR-5R]
MSDIYFFRSFDEKDIDLTINNLIINTPYYFDENEAKSFVNDLISSVDKVYCVEVNNTLCLIAGFKNEIKNNKAIAYIELLYEFFEYKFLQDYYEDFFIKSIIPKIKTQRILSKCTAENYHRFVNNGFKIIRYKKDYKWTETYKADLFLMEFK